MNHILPFALMWCVPMRSSKLDSEFIFNFVPDFLLQFVDLFILQRPVQSSVIDPVTDRFLVCLGMCKLIDLSFL